jgi:hypothetical protein
MPMTNSNAKFTPGGSDSGAVALPVVFRVGLDLGLAHGFARLTVDRGVMVLRPGAMTRLFSRVPRIAHTDRRVLFVKPRLSVPGTRPAVILRDEFATGRVSPPPWNADRLRMAVLAAGFEIDQQTTWISSGSSRGRIRRG